MADSRTTISVIVPAYNAALYIDEALRSAQEALKDMPYEIIVINDGSTDDTEQVLAQWMGRILYYTQDNKGAAVARNVGLGHARGTYIACLDADDIWPQDRMHHLMNEFEKRPDLDIAIGRLQRFEYQEKNSQKTFLNEQVSVPSFGSSVIRVTAFEKIGMLESAYRFHEDVDWFLRAREEGLSIVDLPRVVSYYRLHEHNTTKALTPHDKSLLRVLASSLQRRRFKQIGSLRGSDI